MRFAMAVVAVLFTALWFKTSEAACHGTSDDREVVGYIPDIVFTAGSPESRTIIHRQVIYRARPLTPNGYLPYSECGAIARSNMQGLSIQSTYFDVGAVHGPGEWAGLNGSHGTEGSPIVLAPIGLQLIFDGSAPAGTIGGLEIAQNVGGDGVGLIPRLMSLVNIYVVAPNAPPPRTWFTAIADAASIAGARFVLDHPILNNAPNVPIFVTHARNPPGAANTSPWPHPVSVAYDETLARWTIQNDDAAPMPSGIAFHVRIDPSAKRLSTPRRPPRGKPTYRLRVDDPRTNYNPYATIFVTAASRNPHPIAVRYDAPYWSIVNADGAPVNPGQRFHVQILGGTAYRDDRFRRAFNPLGTNDLSNGAGVDMHGIGVTRNAGADRFLNFAWAAGAGLPMIVTANQTPIARASVVDANYLGVRFTGAAAPANKLAVSHASGAPMRNNSSFNLWAAPTIVPPNIEVCPPIAPRLP
jgi:hypothetical protein